MTHHFRTNSFVKKEFDALSKHAHGRPRQFTKMKKTTGRDKNAFFGVDQFKTFKSSTIDIGELKYLDLNRPHNCKVSLVNMKKNVGRKKLKKFCGYLTKEINTTCDYSKKAAGLDYVQKKKNYGAGLVKFSRKTSRKTHFYSRVYKMKLNSRKKKRKRRRNTFAYFQPSLAFPMIHDPQKARTNSKYCVKEVPSFEERTGRRTPRYPPNTFLSYPNKKNPRKKKTDFIIPMKKMGGRTKKCLWEKRTEKYKGDSHEKNENWPIFKNLEKVKSYDKGWGRMESRGITKLKTNYASSLDYSHTDNTKIKKSNNNIGSFATSNGRKNSVSSIVTQVDMLLKTVEKNNCMWKKVFKNYTNTFFGNKIH